MKNEVTKGKDETAKLLCHSYYIYSIHICLDVQMTEGKNKYEKLFWGSSSSAT